MKHNRPIALFVLMISFFMMLVACSRSSEERQKAEQEMDSIVPSPLNEAEERVASPGENLEQTFEADTLTAEQLIAFQQRGAEKLADFINYIELISNKAYDPQLRLEVRKQAEALFPDPKITIAIAIDEGKKERPVTVFLDDIYKNNYDSIKVKTDSVVLQQPGKGENSIYEGLVSAKVSVYAYKNKKIIFSSTGLRQATIIIQKVEKNFGSDKKMVWETTLGVMK